MRASLLCKESSVALLLVGERSEHYDYTLRLGGSYLRLIGPHSRSAATRGVGGHAPQKILRFRLSEMVSGALLSDKSARQCLTKNNSNKIKTGGRRGQSNLLFASSSARTPHNRVASKIDGWSPCACILLLSIIQATVKVERRLCAFTASIMFSLAPLPAQ